MEQIPTLNAVNTITYDETLNIRNCQFFDLRAPLEYEVSHIPNAINLPIFSNEEREEIGTTYKLFGETKARWQAMKLVSPKIPSILTALKDAVETLKCTPIIYCARGGMRSKSIATFAQLAGLNVNLLFGGYRSYRQTILQKMPKLLPQNAIVLHGKTGVGKTEILQLLQKEGYAVLDLEIAANHRGSIFGSFGMSNPNSQKTFDSKLFEQLFKIKTAKYYIVEAESKRIGTSLVPDFLMEHRTLGIQVMLHRSMKNRIERTYNEYVKPNISKPWFEKSTEENCLKILKRIKNKAVYDAILDALNKKDYLTLISLLLKNYYDPRYQYKENEVCADEFKHIHSDDNEVVIFQIKKLVTMFT